MDHYSRTKAIADQLTLMANGTPLPGEHQGPALSIHACPEMHTGLWFLADMCLLDLPPFQGTVPRASAFHPSEHPEHLLCFNCSEAASKEPGLASAHLVGRRLGLTQG